MARFSRHRGESRSAEGGNQTETWVTSPPVTEGGVTNFGFEVGASQVFVRYGTLIAQGFRP